MEHSRKQKLLMIVALIVGIASLSVGFAAFSVSLNISSSASVTPSSDTFSVKFSTEKDSLVVEPVVPSSIYNATNVTNGIINNTNHPTITNLSASFSAPNQDVEYSFYIRNEGEYTAYLNNVNFIGDKTCVADVGTTDSLVQQACESMKIVLNVDGNAYYDTTKVSNKPLAPGESISAVVGLAYSDGEKYSDGSFKVTFPSISLVYSTIDDSSISGEVIRIVSGDINTIGSVVAIGNEQFYVIGQEDGKVKLLSMYNLHVGNVVNNDKSIVALQAPTGIQYSGAKGHITGGLPFIGVTPFSETDVLYENSIVKGYVDNYLYYLNSLGVTVLDARLINSNELNLLGCSTSACSSVPAWLISSSFWCDGHDDSVGVCVVISDGINSFSSYDYGKALGVRPVIEISLSEF
ncbi:MAG: hypothetical protein J6C28_05955 [Bacilli bacterium]|nr:hypothetical protein [Bacilli bacterium]